MKKRPVRRLGTRTGRKGKVSCLVRLSQTARTIRGYLEGLGALCLETSRNPALLPTFLGVVALVPATIAELRREA
jgi:hypothetical protein